MSELTSRLFRRVSWTIAWSLVGMVVAMHLGATDGWLGLAVAASAALAVLSGLLWDAYKLHQLLVWLADPAAGTAPRDAGYWGEVSYRLEKSVRGFERAIAEERAAHRDFLGAIDASPNGVTLLDEQEHIRWLNGTACAHFGLDPQRDIAQKMGNLVRVPGFVQALHDGLDGPVVWHNARTDTSLSAIFCRYGRGQTLVLTQDVSERERHEAMRRAFVANASHEMRTPLTVLSGFIESLQTLPLDADEKAQVMGHMKRQTERMSDLIADMLTLAELEGRASPEANTPVDVARLVASCVTDAKHLSQGAHLIEADLGEQSWCIQGSERELQSALGNLLSNAVRFTPPGGTIRVYANHSAGSEGRLTVTDTGPGIDAIHLPRLSERFYRVDDGRTRSMGGTGLGLAIVKHVMVRHAGRLEIASEVGMGSTFTLVFPAYRTTSTEVPAVRR